MSTILQCNDNNVQKIEMKVQQMIIIKKMLLKHGTTLIFDTLDIRQIKK